MRWRSVLPLLALPAVLIITAVNLMLLDDLHDSSGRHHVLSGHEVTPQQPGGFSFHHHRHGDGHRRTNDNGGRVRDSRGQLDAGSLPQKTARVSTSASADRVAARVAELTKRMKYWTHDPHPTHLIHKAPEPEKYLVFQTWEGGFNNERMSVEWAFVLSLISGRTLVMPPPYNLYLIEPSDLSDYFDMKAIHAGTRAITFDQFCSRTGIERPEEKYLGFRHPVWKTISNRKDTLRWADWQRHNQKLTFCYPGCPAPGTDKFKELEQFALADAVYIDYHHNKSLIDPGIIFIPSHELFDHFYTHFWFEDRELELEVLRAVRDHIHYVPEVFEYAAEVVARLPPKFNAVHVRRGDFQYKDISLVPAKKLIDNTIESLPRSEPLWLATDEKNQSFADEWRDAWEPRPVYMLNDYSALLSKIGCPKKLLGLVEQVICTQAQRFVGTRLSTFSGYITRMRGYMHMDNFETYFTTEDSRKYMKVEREKGREGFRPGDQKPEWRPMWLWASWGREFPHAHNFGKL